MLWFLHLILLISWSERNIGTIYTSAPVLSIPDWSGTSMDFWRLFRMSKAVSPYRPQSEEWLSEFMLHLLGLLSGLIQFPDSVVSPTMEELLMFFDP